MATIDIGSLVFQLEARGEELGIGSLALQLETHGEQLGIASTTAQIEWSNLIFGEVSSAGAIVQIEWAPHSGDGMESPYKLQDTNITTQVYSSSDEVPLTGIWSGSYDGWVWDRRTLEDLGRVSTKHNSYLGGHSVGLVDGTLERWWQSGTVSDIEYLRIDFYPDTEILAWTPVVRTGIYSIHTDTFVLYSDHSECGVPVEDDGVWEYPLPEGCRTDTITAKVFRRQSGIQNISYREYVPVEVFTGEIVNGERLPTVDGSGVIQWANISTRKYEFTIKDDVLVLNQDPRVQVGNLDAPWDAPDLPYVAESLGAGNPDGRFAYLEFWPVQEGTVQVVVVNEFNAAIEWTEVDSFEDSSETDNHFVVDYDLGILEFGGYQAPDLTLREPLSDTETDSIVCFLDPDALGSYPDRGTILIGTEKIKYESKTYNGFATLTRGVDSTTAASYPAGETISHVQGGVGIPETSSIYVSYTAIPRIECETTDCVERTTTEAGPIDVSPVRNTAVNSVLQISATERHLSRIVLEPSVSHMGGNLYGPVFLGSDVCRLTATAYDSFGNPVQGIPITIEIQEGSGFLNGTLSAVTRTSNALGESYALYTIPYDTDAISHIAGTVTQTGSGTEIDFPTLPNLVDLEDITIFQILKHDRSMGGVPVYPDLVSVNGDRVVLDTFLSDKFQGGALVALGSLNGEPVRLVRTIRKVFHIEDGGVTKTELVISSPIDPDVQSISNLSLRERDAVLWRIGRLNGVRVLLYDWDTQAIHPLTGDPGAYAPVLPDSIDGTTLTFLGRSLPTPEPANDSVNLGAYLAVAPTDTTLIASARDPATGRIIKSNVVRLRVEIPQMLRGVDTSGPLPIPYGFTFVTDDFNVGAGLGGANFLTVNPVAEGIDTFSIYAEME